ncbi:unnamed protein product [Vicia faba]|uniref:PPM-type phosphatase domain-containing protein n=1 Tax=Vicia faba TaxID=3906 RepID=A0AAV1B629_VICFA|nr:unnamed protein product [Vicia faba]
MKRFSLIVFLEVDNDVRDKVNDEPIAPGTVGSTNVVATVCPSHIIVSNCGNSRAVLYCGHIPEQNHPAASNTNQPEHASSPLSLVRTCPHILREKLLLPASNSQT